MGELSLVYELSKLQELSLNLRSCVEELDFAARLESKPKKWRQLCSAMDAIDDTAMAVASFSRLPESQDKGQLYLRVYGLLQCMFVQQWAVVHAAEALGLKTDVLDQTAEIRNMRNSTVGHPSKKDRPPEPGAYGIVQSTLSSFSFQWYSFDLESWQNNNEPRSVVICDLIREQETLVSSAIEDLIEKLSRGKK